MTPIRITLRALREEAGISQEQLADATGSRQATISNLERGLTTRVEFELLDRLSEVLSAKLKRPIGPGELLERTERRPARKGR